MINNDFPLFEPQHNMYFTSPQHNPGYRMPPPPNLGDLWGEPIFRNDNALSYEMPPLAIRNLPEPYLKYWLPQQMGGNRFGSRYNPSLNGKSHEIVRNNIQLAEDVIEAITAMSVPSRPSDFTSNNTNFSINFINLALAFINETWKYFYSIFPAIPYTPSIIALFPAGMRIPPPPNFGNPSIFRNDNALYYEVPTLGIRGLPGPYLMYWPPQQMGGNQFGSSQLPHSNMHDKDPMPSIARIDYAIRQDSHYPFYSIYPKKPYLPSFFLGMGPPSFYADATTKSDSFITGSNNTVNRPDSNNSSNSVSGINSLRSEDLVDRSPCYYSNLTESDAFRKPQVLIDVERKRKKSTTGGENSPLSNKKTSINASSSMDAEESIQSNIDNAIAHVLPPPQTAENETCKAAKPYFKKIKLELISEDEAKSEFPVTK